MARVKNAATASLPDVVVLGIDPGWKPESPSGVGLVKHHDIGWVCVAVAPSYQQFIGLAAGQRIDWETKVKGAQVHPKQLLEAAAYLAGKQPSIVVLDIPLSRQPITGRRFADNTISVDWGAFHASTHSPLPDRPGPLSQRLRDEWQQVGFSLATNEHTSAKLPVIIETYPHPIAMTICRRSQRVQYKVAKMRRYWPDDQPERRLANLTAEWRCVTDALGQRIDLSLSEIRSFPRGTRRSAWKAQEDCIDALLCCIAGIAYSEGAAEPFGDADAAIWLPIECCVHREGLKR